MTLKNSGNRPKFEPIDFDIPPYFIDYSTILYSFKLHSRYASQDIFTGDTMRTRANIHMDWMIS